MLRGFRVLAAVFCFAGLSAAQATYVVPTGFPTINSAMLFAQSGDRVEVLPGTYAEFVDFLGKDIELVAVGGPNLTLIDASPLGPTQTGSVITFLGGESRAAVLDGFRIRGGQATILGAGFGGGVTCLNASPTIRNCIIELNIGASGGVGTQQIGGAGGIQVTQGSPLIEDCLIRNNLGGPGGLGPSLSAITTAYRGGAGAIDLRGAGPGVTEIRRCILLQNSGGASSLNFTPGITLGAPPHDFQRGGTGGIESEDGSVVALSDCLIVDNFGGSGPFAPSLNAVGPRGTGGLRGLGFAEMRRLTIVTNCSGLQGDNTTDDHSGGLYFSGPSAPIDSSIIWGNVDPLQLVDNYGEVFPPVTYSIVEGPMLSGLGNSNASPQFVDALNCDYRLADTSPGIDAARPGGALFFERDVLGGPRLSGAGLDMGCYELNQTAGSVEDFCMTSTVNGIGDPNFPIKTALPGDTVQLAVSSPSGTFNAAVPVLIAQAFLAPSPPLSPPGFPYIHVSVPGLSILYDGNLFGPVTITSAGAVFNFPVHLALSGAVARVQALALSPLAANGLFAASNAFDFIVL